MHSVIAFLVFGIGLTAALSTIVLTLVPQAGRIAALLRTGASMGTNRALPPPRAGRDRVTARMAVPERRARWRAAA